MESRPGDLARADARPRVAPAPPAGQQCGVTKRTRPSRTARIVAATRRRVPRATAASGDADGDQRLARSVAIPFLVDAPGMRAYIAARTAFYDRVLLDACESGVRQVVIVAAGYDGRALRFRQPGVRFFEIDHPATQSDKRARLRRLSIAADDVSFVPVDLGRDSITDALTAAGHDTAQRTHFMCEGLTMYLPQPVLVRLLGALAEAAAPESTIAADFLAPGRAVPLVSRVQVAFVRRGTAALGEPMITRLDGMEVDALLRDTGWSSVERRPGLRWPVVFALATRDDTASGR